MSTGKPSKYPTHVQPRLETIRAWKRDGLTEEQICENLGVCQDSFIQYKKIYPELVEVLKIGFDDAIAHVENAMMKRALGYTYIETTITRRKIVLGEDKDEPNNAEVIETKTVEKQMAPDVAAQIFIKINRRPDKWRNQYGQSDKAGDTGTLDELTSAITESAASLKSGGSDVG
jgi:hypothetical protein